MQKIASSIILLVLWCGSAFAATTFERVLVHGSDVKAGVLAGAGTAVSSPLFDSEGNRVRWRVKRDELDEFGMRHVFYVQVVDTPAGEALISGTDAGLHYAADGTLRSIGGHQVRSLSIANKPRFGINDAAPRILAALRRSTPSPMAPGEIRALRTPGLIVVTKSGVSRLAYELVVEDGAGLPYRVAIDASSEQIVRVIAEFASGNCSPTEPLSISSATGIPIRDGVPERPLTANYTGGRPVPGSILTHEGYRPAQWNVPTVLPLQQTTNGNFMCEGVNEYTLFPLRAPGGTPTFDNFGDEWLGREAGDAMYHTIRTMEVFSSLGRNGWDGSGTDANVMVDAFRFLGDDAFFVNVATNSARRGVVVTRRSQITYGLEAALDVIAHEWGHGIVYTSPGIQYDTALEQQLHEGFADVIGHIVEKMAQPPGLGLEQSSDWDIAEDAGVPGGYLRRADADDGAGRLKYHRDDGEHLGAAHDYGNMLGVAFYVLVEGETNPWCRNHPTAFGCDAWTPGLSLGSASDVMLRALTRYVTSTATWEELANYAKLAAFDLYHNCNAAENRNAEWEQEQVEQAFLSIGYPGQEGPYEFCPLNPE